MQRRLEEEHALQMSLLLAEQEKEQQRLRLVSTWNHMTHLGSTQSLQSAAEKTHTDTCKLHTQALGPTETCCEAKHLEYSSNGFPH